MANIKSRQGYLDGDGWPKEFNKKFIKLEVGVATSLADNYSLLK
jgi:hypothetical protein